MEAHETLKKTLLSYKKENFLSLFDESVIYFSDISEADQKIAKDFGFRAVGGPNKGISAGTENLAKALQTDYILIVQNDNPLIEDFSFAKKHLTEALHLLETKQADLIRMRHRWHVGQGFSDVKNYLKYFPLSEKDNNFKEAEHENVLKNSSETLMKKIYRFVRPFKTHHMKGRSLFIEKHPEKLFPEVITKQGHFLIADSSVINFSDQCFLTSKKLFLEILMAYVNTHPKKRTLNGFQVPEICLNSPWWRKKHFKIAQGRGLFTHNRFDGSFRKHS